MYLFIYLFEIGFLWVALSVWELTLSTRLASNSEIQLLLPPVGSKPCSTTAWCLILIYRSMPSFFMWLFRYILVLWMYVPMSVYHTFCILHSISQNCLTASLMIDVQFLFFITYFPQLHFQCYPKSPTYPPPHFLTHLFSFFWPWRPPVLGYIKFVCPMGLSFQWWPTRPSFDTYAARVKSSGLLVSS